MSERRRYPRLAAPILMRPVSPLAYAARRRVSDVSAGGLRTYSDEETRPGTRLELELLFPNEGSVTVLAEVVWVKSLPRDAPARFDVGIRFVDARPEDLSRIERFLQDE